MHYQKYIRLAQHSALKILHHVKSVRPGLSVVVRTADDSHVEKLKQAGATEVVAEVERYIAIPSQALAYKIGALKIQELRAKAQKALGGKFDIKAFHAQVLGTGGLPLPVLESKIDRWIASQR